MKSAIRIIVASVIFLSLLFCVHATPEKVFAATSSIPNQNLSGLVATQKAIDNISAVLVCQLAGVNPITLDHTCLSPKMEHGSITYTMTNNQNNFGFIGFLGSAIDQSFNIPISTQDSFAYLKQNFGLAKPAYADGIGANNIYPLVNIWIIFRNICLILFMLILVVIGFLIMLRVKIDQRTVFALENQLPKIVLVLILVNFSFAISGLLIDFMHVSDSIVYNILDPYYPSPSLNPVKLTNSDTNTFSIVNMVTGEDNAATALGDHLSDVIHPLIVKELNIDEHGTGSIVSTGLASTIPILGPSISGLARIHFGESPFNVAIDLLSYSLGDSLAQWLSTLLAEWDVAGFNGGPLLALPARIATATGFTFATDTFIRAYAIGAFLSLVFIIGIIIAIVKMLINLISSYIAILFGVVLAPIYIMTDLIPGSTGGFTSWLKMILSNLLVFPATIGILHLSADMAHAVASTDQSTFFRPPFIPSGIAGDGLKYLIQFGGILAASMIRDPIQKAFKQDAKGFASQLMGTAFIGATLLQKGARSFKAPDLTVKRPPRPQQVTVTP